jgi:Holliday junction resolvase RusA-like endonuclease
MSEEPLVLAFVILGHALTKRRARGIYDPRLRKVVFRSDPATKTWEKWVKWEAIHAINLLKERGIDWPTDRRYEAHLVFHHADKRHRDGDNLQKAVLDGCNGVVYADDSQVDKKSVEKRFDAEQPRTEVVFKVIG